MAKRNEPAWQTFMRIEVVCLQGFVYYALVVVFSVVIMPLIFCEQYWLLVSEGYRNRPWWSATGMLVPWLLVAALDAVSTPFVAFGKGMRDIMLVGKAEWDAGYTSAEGSNGPPHDYLADVLDDYTEPLFAEDVEIGEDA